MEFICEEHQISSLILKSNIHLETTQSTCNLPASDKMPPRKRGAADDSSSEDEINVDKMIETKDELNKVASMPCLDFDFALLRAFGRLV